MSCIQADLMDILCCPVCKGDLKLEVQRQDGPEIMEGTLACARCRHAYPIEDGIPNLLPPDVAGE